MKRKYKLGDKWSSDFDLYSQNGMWYIKDMRENNLVKSSLLGTLNQFEKKHEAQFVLEAFRERMESQMAQGGTIENTKSLKAFVIKCNEYANTKYYGTISKGDLMKVAYGENYTNVDSAIPMGMLTELGIDNKEAWHYVMDYHSNGAFGRLTDLFDVISKKNPVIEIYNESGLLDTLPIMEAVGKYQERQVLWQLKSDQYAKGGNITNFNYSIGGL